MQKPLRKAIWAGSLLWILSWFALYLEVYRWHHVAPSPHLNGSPPPPGTDIQSRPGGFLIAVLASSALAPPVFVALLIWTRPWGPNTVAPQRNKRGICSHAALPLVAFGIALSVLGLINHLIHEPLAAIDFDITMRHGDGGFIVNGTVLAVLGFILRRSRVRQRNRA